MEWTAGDWQTVRPWFPVITVEGDFVWLRKCQVRVLRHVHFPYAPRNFDIQYRSLPISDIWMDAEELTAGLDALIAKEPTP